MGSKIIFVHEKRRCVEFRQNTPNNSHNPYVQDGAKRTHVFEIGSTSERYDEMLRNFLRPQLRSLRVNMVEMWFQQDGATAHTARASMTVVQ